MAELTDRGPASVFLSNQDRNNLREANIEEVKAHSEEPPR
jgi:hypothetical protein